MKPRFEFITRAEGAYFWQAQVGRTHIYVRIPVLDYWAGVNTNTNLVVFETACTCGDNPWTKCNACVEQEVYEFSCDMETWEARWR